MMGLHQPQDELFSYKVNLERRVRLDHPLRAIATQIDFEFIRKEVAHHYGPNGNVSVDPAVLLKLMFLLFFDDIASERELMGMVGERMDYLWFLGYGLDDPIPNHSVLSKARKRWGKEVFEQFFVRTVMQCVQAGLVDGKKIHLDSSLIDANASTDSVLTGSPELIGALKKAYAAQESKLEETMTSIHYEAVNDRMMSSTDPDAPVVRKGGGGSRPRYHHHRAIDDANGVITAVETTPGTIAENRKLVDLVEEHRQNTERPAEIVVADSKYGTVDNFVVCQKMGITTHMGDVLRKQNHERQREGIYPESAFAYQPQSDTYLCPAGKEMRPRRLHALRRVWEYITDPGVCAACTLRSQCTRSRTGRSVQRHENQELLEKARDQSLSAAGKADRRRRQELMERSFADAANNHGFKRSRWRRLWRQEIQDWLIAGIQNIRILLSRTARRPKTAMGTVLQAVIGLEKAVSTCHLQIIKSLHAAIIQQPTFSLS